MAATVTLLKIYLFIYLFIYFFILYLEAKISIQVTIFLFVTGVTYVHQSLIL